MEPRIRQDNHLAIKLGNQGLKMGVVDCGGGTIPGINQAIRTCTKKHQRLIQVRAQVGHHMWVIWDLPPNLSKR
jgi:hypothetical protein